MEGKDIHFRAEARARIARGIGLLCETVAVTLGPKGRTVFLDKEFGTLISKDGVTVAKAIELADKFENMGVEIVREAAIVTADEVGDGTTTAIVLAGAIVREGVKAVEAGFDPMDVRRGIEMAVEAVADELGRQSRPIASRKEIARVAAISANGDRDIGRMVAEALDGVGREGVVTVEEGKTLETTLTVVEGMRFDRGYVSAYLVTDSRTMRCELEDPLILIHDGKLARIGPLMPILDSVAESDHPLLVIAEDVEGEALAALVVNKQRGGLEVVAVKAPGFGDRRKAMLEDIAVLTSGEVIADEMGIALENVTLEMLGAAERVEVAKNETVIVGGGGAKRAVRKRCALLRAQIAEAKAGYDRERLQERLARLAAGAAVIRVGGASEAEVKERRDRFAGALHAARAAVEEGILPGGGTALLRAARALDGIGGANDDRRMGVDVVRRALAAPLCRIVDNAGHDGAWVAGKLLAEKRAQVGFDAEKGIFTDLLKAGIIDPTKVVRLALRNAASVASLVIATEVAVADRPASG